MQSATLARPATAASTPAAMRAARIHRFGPPDVITLETIPRPYPGPGEVLVRVHAAGVGPWDAWIRAGQSALPQPLPLTLGSDISGTIEQLGPDVTVFAPGDQVFGVTNTRFTGGYAEYAVVTASMLAEKPHSLDHLHAAGIPVVSVTAWQALFEQARVGPGQTVLILGAAGNVGAFAVQLAHLTQAHVIATCGADDASYVQAIGADTIVDHRTGRFGSIARSADVVIDLVGGEIQMRSFATLKAGGTLVSTVAPPDQGLAARHGVKALFFLVEITTMHLTRLADMIDSGELRFRLGHTLTLDEASLAHEMLGCTRSRGKGKIVLDLRR